MKAMNYCQAVFALAASVVLSNCAGTTPKANFSTPMTENSRIYREDKVHTKVVSTDGNMQESDKQRLAGKIASNVSSIASSRSGAAQNYELAVTISRYDKGNAFARAMSAGLGQIHINGVATVYQNSGRKKVGEFTLNKTFAWGGIYGATVSMETIEDTYAKAVAEAVTQSK